MEDKIKKIRNIKYQLKILKKNPNPHTFSTIRAFEKELREIE